jgi:microcystin-dependent protein
LDQVIGDAGSYVYPGGGTIGAYCVLGQIYLFPYGLSSGIVGVVPADGRLLLIQQNQALFSLLGTRFGGDGITTFAVPDLRTASPNGTSYAICVSGAFP